MNFSTEDFDQTTVLSIGGELDAVSVAELRSTLDGLAAGERAHIIIDLTKLRVIDSSGVGAIVSLYKRTRAKGGNLSVRGLCEQPLAIFRLLRLDRVLAA